MLIDSRDLRDGTVEADVCVVGAGAAGIALALELDATPLSVAVVETGGLTGEQDGSGIYRVLGARTPTLSSDPSRPWMFGGNTNYWAGNCRPLDEADFEPRDWIPNSGWPIGRQELLPYYLRAQSVSGLSDFRWYDPPACAPYLEHALLDLDPEVLTNRIVHTCPVLSFTELYRSRLEASNNVQILLRSRATRLTTENGGDQVSAVEVTLADGRQGHVEAGTFILAAGGVENARLLLCSNDRSSDGLGNGQDLVGRYFMEHWYVDLGLAGWDSEQDLTAHTYPERQEVGGASLWAQLETSEVLSREESVPALLLWFQRRGLDSPSVAGWGSLVGPLRGRKRSGTTSTDLRLMLTDPGEVAAHTLRKLRRRRPLNDRCSLRIQFEQVPDPENRVRLSSEQDSFGEPRAELALRLSDEELSGFRRSFDIAADELRLNSQRLSKQMVLMLEAGHLDFFWHHSGTTRMSDDPELGVVDADCRVHGVTNLFVAGSSVFPTSGTAAPTLTIVALALRLADRLRELANVSA